MNEIIFESKDFEKYIKGLLDKYDDEKIYAEELVKIDTVVLNSKNLRGLYLDIRIEDLLKFSNLKSCFIKNMQILDEHIGILNSIRGLEELQFDKCDFQIEDVTLCNDIKAIAIVNCYNFKTDMISSLEDLEILMIKGIQKLKTKELEKLPKLQDLYLQGMDKLELNFLKSLSNIKLLNIKDSTLKKPEELEMWKNVIKIEGNF